MTRWRPSPAQNCPADRFLVRADSAFYGHGTVSATRKAGAEVSITARMDPAIKRAIASISADAWTKIQYTNAILDEATGQWVSVAEVAEIPFTAFTSRKKSEQIAGRLVVRRIPDLAPTAAPGQGTLFDHWRFHAFFTTTDHEVLDTVAADKTHRQHAIIEQSHADLKNGPLAHLPSGVFNANAAWLILAVIAFNLVRAAGTICGGEHARATTNTLRRKIITVPARIACSARKHLLHLPADWPWENAWTALFARALSPPTAVST
ncbi:MAG: IS1380 family transposase [Dermatophilaceae bacterium]|nr:IS1380 family transposase [Dermatophilaceae bacterium]